MAEYIERQQHYQYTSHLNQIGIIKLTILMRGRAMNRMFSALTENRKKVLINVEWSIL